MRRKQSLILNSEPERLTVGVGYCTYAGTSMNPTLSQEDILEVEPADPLMVGDVVLFSSDHRLVVHRVVGAWRGDRRRSIAGGRAGRLFAAYARLRRLLYGKALRVVSPSYNSLSRWGLFCPLGRLLRLRLVGFGDGELQLMLGSRVAAYCRPGREWVIRPPYRLIVNDSSLPRQATPISPRTPPFHLHNKIR
ncbi:MAG: S26 family signal peptidase [Methanothrix sp.]|nr:S26 family signal peptidase [Methanothrix sp.]